MCVLEHKAQKRRPKTGNEENKYQQDRKKI